MKTAKSYQTKKRDNKNHKQGSETSFSNSKASTERRFSVQSESNDNLAMQQIFASAPLLQAKFKLSQLNDPYEREADQVADLHHESIYNDRNPKISAVSNKLQTKQKTSTGNVSSGHINNHSISSKKLNSAMTAGKPLTRESRQFFEPRYGCNLEQVRIHTGSLSNQLAQQLNAKAFTHGNNIVFNNSYYRPYSRTGKQLLAHEITHVLQQQGNPQNIIARDPVCSMDEPQASEPEVLECRDDSSEQNLQEGANFSAINVSQLSDYELLVHYRSNQTWLNNNPVVLLEWGERSDYQQRLEKEIERRPGIGAAVDTQTDDGNDDFRY